MKRKPRTAADLIGELPTKPTAKRGRPVEAHRVRLATAQAENVELRTAKLRGELVKASDVQAEWESLFTDLRASLLAMPSRVGAKLALDRPTVAALDREVRAYLAALAASGGRTEAL